MASEETERPAHVFASVWLDRNYNARPAWVDDALAEAIAERDARIRAEARREAIEEAMAITVELETDYGTDAEGAGGQDFTDAIAAEAALHQLVGRLRKALLSAEATDGG